MILGGAAVLVAILFGLGALGMWLYEAYARAARASAAV
jgi:hypothetical protein